MKHIAKPRFSFIAGLLGVLLSTQLWASEAITGIEVTPPDIDFDVITRLWGFVKKTTDAPGSLPPPPLVLDWHVPPFARMGFQYPTPQFPDNIKTRTNDAGNMTSVASTLSNDDIENLAHYIAGLN